MHVHAYLHVHVRMCVFVRLFSCVCVYARNNLSGLAVQYVCYAFVHDCYAKLSGIATFSIVVFHRVAF